MVLPWEAASAQGLSPEDMIQLCTQIELAKKGTC